LRFSTANPENQPVAKVKIYYKIMESFENTELLDSATKLLTVKRAQASEMLSIRFPVSYKKSEKFITSSYCNRPIKQQDEYRIC
jgi:hypothetical protein